jgi:uncharacterized protein YndB with AHSA1/START domain
MKRLLKWIAIVVASLVVAVGLFVVSGYLLPRETTIDIESTLDARPEALFALFTDYEGVERWWQQAATDMGDDLRVTHLGGPRQGAGMEVGFAAANGPLSERWSYTAVQPTSQIEIDVDFQIFTARRVLELAPEGTGTTVRWRETALVDGPVWRWMVKLNADSAIDNRRKALSAAETTARQPQ